MTSLDPLPVMTTPTKERVANLDNARYWVMLLVVIGHSLTQFARWTRARASTCGSTRSTCRSSS